MVTFALGFVWRLGSSTNDSLSANETAVRNSHFLPED
jgi:hypothetical protein